MNKWKGIRNGNIYIAEIHLVQLGYLHFIRIEEENYRSCAGLKRELNRRYKKGLIKMSDLEEVKQVILEGINLNVNNFFSEIFLIYYN